MERPYFQKVMNSHLNFKGIFIGLTFSFVFVNISFAATSCEIEIDDRMKEISDEYSKSLSAALSSSEKKSLVIHETAKDLRSFHCDLQKVCSGFLINQQESFVYPGCSVEPFKKEDLLCAINESSIAEVVNKNSNLYQTCQTKAQEFEEVAMIVTEGDYLESSKQDDGNYYSAKLLSLSVRLKNLGEVFENLRQKMSSVFSAITCYCSE